MNDKREWLVIDLGGSIIAPGQTPFEGPDVPFAQQIIAFFQQWLLQDARRCLGLVIGGGAPARNYQRAVQAVRQGLAQNTALAELQDEALDWLGIRATHLNGEYLRLLTAGLQDTAGRNLLQQPLLQCYDELPDTAELGRIVVGGGWKPGFSTDYDAVLLAEHVGAQRLLCLSNIAQIYTDDPRTNPAAQPLPELDWKNYQNMVGTEWKPGRSMPFDPIATAHAAQIGLELVFADGRDLENLARILNGEDFVGTVVR